MKIRRVCIIKLGDKELTELGVIGNLTVYKNPDDELFFVDGEGDVHGSIQLDLVDFEHSITNLLED